MSSTALCSMSALLYCLLLLGCGDAKQGAGPGSVVSSNGVSAEDTTDGATSTGGGEPTSLCDGSPGLVLAIYIPPGNVGTDDLVLWELGGRFLFVLGDCRYWVSGPDNPSRRQHYHTGVLTGSQQTLLQESFFFGEWTARSLTGLWERGQATFDVSSIVFQSREGDIVCDGGCGSEANPDEVRRMRDAEQPMIQELYQSGSAYTDALRIQVIYKTSPPEPNVSWPLSWPITDIAVQGEQLEQLQPGMSTLIDDPTEANALRAIWDEYLSGAHGENWKSTGGIPFEDPSVQGEDFYVSMRDTLPFEDANGLVTVCTAQSQTPEALCTMRME